MTQKQKQSVIVNLNLDKAKKKRKARRKAVKRGGGGLGPSRGVGTMFPYGFPPQQQSVQPTLNNITDYLKTKEGQDNGRHVNIMAAMRAIQRDEGRQGTAVQSEEGAGSSTQAPAAEGAEASKEGGKRAGRKKGSTKTDEQLEEARKAREDKLIAKRLAEQEALMSGEGGFLPTGKPAPTKEPKPDYKAGPTRDLGSDAMAVSQDNED